MTGLSNHALSTAPRSPLLTLFDARPIGIEGRSGLRVKTRSAGETLLVKALRVTLTVPGQYYESGRLGQGLENSRSHSNKKQRWVRSLKLQMPSGRCWSLAAGLSWPTSSPSATTASLHHLQVKKGVLVPSLSILMARYLQTTWTEVRRCRVLRVDGKVIVVVGSRWR